MRRGSELSILLGVLRRRRWLLAAGLLLGLVLAVLLGASSDRYRAEAQLLIGAPGTGNTDAQSLERNLNSQISVLQSPATARDVATRLGGGTTAAEVLSSTSIEQVPGADVVRVVTTATDAASAAALADAYVEVYLDNSSQRAGQRLAPEVQRLDERLAALRTEIDAASAQIAEALSPFLGRTSGVPDPSVVAPEAAAQQRLLLSEYDRVLEQRELLQQQLRLTTVSSVLQEAAVDDEPLGPDRRRQVGLVLASVLLAALLALALEVRSGRPVHEAEVEQALGVPLAGQFGDDERLRRAPVDVLDLDRLPTEEQRTLWLAVDRLSPVDGPALLLVTGASTGSGTSTLALVLARQMALTGRRTAYVDASGGPSSVSAHLGVQGPGLGDLPAARLLPDALVAVDEDLDVLPRGSSRRLPGRVLEEAVRALSTSYDAVVVDTEPGLGSAASLTRAAHAVVLVVDGRRAGVTELEHWGVALEHLRDRLLPVLNTARGRQEADVQPRPVSGRQVEPRLEAAPVRG